MLPLVTQVHELATRNGVRGVLLITANPPNADRDGSQSWRCLGGARLSTCIAQQPLAVSWHASFIKLPLTRQAVRQGFVVLNNQ